MRLTISDKRAFVRAVMADIPSTDYQVMSRKLLTDWLVDQMPPKVRAVWDDKDTRDYLQADETYSPDGCFFTTTVSLVPWRMIDKDVVKEMQAFVRLHDKQALERQALREKVNALICSCTTLKQALGIVPETLHKYLPTPRDGTATKNVPVVVTEIVNALQLAGWVAK